MASELYYAAVCDALKRVFTTQAEKIAAAADALSEAVTDGRGIFSFGASHSFIMTEELVYRTGGLMLINPIYPEGMNLFVRPITDTSRRERILGLGKEILEKSPIKDGDVLLIASTSGRNAVVIDMAQRARERGIFVIGIVSFAYSGGVSSRHPSGRKLGELCSVALDNGVPYGDAAVEMKGFPQKVGPLSTVTGCALVNALVCEVVERLVRKGIEPPVFMSANLDGGDEFNARLIEKNRHRIHYL